MPDHRSGVACAVDDGGVRSVRLLLVLCALLASGACTGARPARCDFTETRQIAFTSADGGDRVTARSFGISCDKALGVYEVTDPEGRPVWAWATPLARSFGDVFTAEEPDHVRVFLSEWADPVILTTLSAPEWSALAPGQTTLDELTYADIRARDLPMLCHYSGTARQTCVFWEPAAGGAGHMFDRDVEETLE